MSPTLEDFENEKFGKIVNPIFAKEKAEEFLDDTMKAFNTYCEGASAQEDDIWSFSDIYRFRKMKGYGCGKLLYYKINPNTKEAGFIIVLDRVKFEYLNQDQSIIILEASGGKKEDIPWYSPFLNTNRCLRRRESGDIEDINDYYDELLEVNSNYYGINDKSMKVLGETRYGYALFPIIVKNAEEEYGKGFNVLLEMQEREGE